MADVFRKEIVPGLFIVVAICLLIVLVFTIKPPGGVLKPYTIKVRFDTIAGLRENAPVWFAGVEKYKGLDVGRVKNIHIVTAQNPVTGEEQFLIEVNLEINELIRITEGTQFRIASKGLAGYPHVEIIPGPSTGRLLSLEQVHHGNRPPDDMFTTMQELSQIVKAMELDKLGPKIHRAVENIGNLTEEITYAATDIKEIVASIKEDKSVVDTMNNLKTATAKSITMIDSANETLGDAKVFFTKINGTVERVDSILDENRDKINSMITSLDEVAQKLNTDLFETLDKFDTLLTGISVFLADNKEEISAIITNLRMTTQNAKLFTQDIKMNPWKLLFRGKEKDQRDQLRPQPDKGLITERGL
ncbi:MAG: MlaD family protein [Candidatus Auribacterota bacterium]|nr:MlaD family protein [Candidatus Auribacterota bacterium]